MTPPQESELAPQPKPWPGNLPCCPGRGPREDGCDAHNPAGEQLLFWDPTLFPPLHTNKGGPKNKSTNGILSKILSVLTGANSRNTVHPNKKKEKEGASTGTLATPTVVATSLAAPALIYVPPTLPRDSPAACTSLPLVHPFVPFYLCFYHVFAAMHAATSMTCGDGAGVIRERVPAEQDLLDALACRGVTGSRSGWWRRLMQPIQITWSVRPRIISSDSEGMNRTTGNAASTSMVSTAGTKHFLIEYDYSFFIYAEHPGGPKVSPTRGYYSMRWLNNFSLRGGRAAAGSSTFAPCPHCRVVFRSVTERVDWHSMRSMSVGYSVSIPGTSNRSSNTEYVEEKGDGRQAELVQHYAEWKTGDEVMQGQQSPQVANVLRSCGMCYTDFGIRFQEGSLGVRVVVLVYKDLGSCGGHEREIIPDEYWKAATGVAGVDLSGKRTLPLQRPRSDFGRVAGVFSGMPRI